MTDIIVDSCTDHARELQLQADCSGEPGTRVIGSWNSLGKSMEDLGGTPGYEEKTR